MARVYMCGFESGSIKQADYYNTSVISSAKARTGSYSAFIETAGTSVIRINLPAAVAEIYLRAGIYLTDAGGAYDHVLFRDNAGTDQVYLRFADTGAGTIYAYRESNNLLATSSVGALEFNEWHCLEVHLVIDNSSGVVQVKVDGVLYIDESNIDTQNSANADVQQIQFGGTSGSNYFTGYVDDLAVNDTNGSANVSWIGRGGIYAIFPNAAGASTDLTPSSGANYAAVDDVPPDDDTTYVEGASVDDHDSYAMSDLSPTAGTISSACWWVYGKLDEAGTGEFAPVLRSGGTDYTGTDQVLDTDYNYYYQVYETDPDTSSAWTVAGINAAEAGVKVR